MTIVLEKGHAGEIRFDSKIHWTPTNRHSYGEKRGEEMTIKIPRIVTERATQKYVSARPVRNSFGIDSLANKDTHAVSLEDGFYNESNQRSVKVYR